MTPRISWKQNEPVPQRIFQLGDKVQEYNWHCSLMESVNPTVLTVTKLTTVDTFAIGNHHRIQTRDERGNIVEAAEFFFKLA